MNPFGGSSPFGDSGGDSGGEENPFDDDSSDESMNPFG